MAINYRDYEGDMCGKCIYMDMRDRASFFSDRYKCCNGEGYQAWSSRPCSRYNPDNSDNRIQTIEKGREGRL